MNLLRLVIFCFATSLLVAFPLNAQLSDDIELSDDEFISTVSPIFNKTVAYPNEIRYYGIIGLGIIHASLDNTLSFTFKSGTEVGVGYGEHFNTINLPINNDNQDLNASTWNIYLNFKYNLLDYSKWVQPYIKSKIGFGYTRQSAEFNNVSLSPGLMLENGFGASFKIGSERYFIELCQYNFNTKGIFISDDPNILSDVRFNMWFNRVILRLGISIPY